MAPWWRQVSMHAFRTGIRQCAEALKNFNDSRNGSRAGRKVRFPNFKSRRRSKLSVTFVELNHQLSWLAGDRHHVRLMLPQIKGLGRARREQLGWIHTVQSTRRHRTPGDVVAAGRRAHRRTRARAQSASARTAPEQVGEAQPGDLTLSGWVEQPAQAAAASRQAVRQGRRA